MNILKQGLAIGAMAGLLATPVLAQNHKFSFGLHGGILKPGAIAELDDNELKVDTELSYGGGAELWFGRVGLRGDFTYMENTFEPDIMGEPAVYMADGSLLFRLMGVEPRRKFAPFLSLGTGWMWWDPNDPPETEQFQVIDRPEFDARLTSEARGEWTIVPGIGADLFLVPNAAIRLEVRDHFAQSPYERLSTGRHHDWHHNVNFSAGLQIFLGGGGISEPGFVQRPEPAPRPTPAPQPRPEPEPEPRFENVTMCVVGDNGRLTTVSAVRNLDTRELFVVRGTTRTAFERAHPVTEPRYVRSSTWYVNDRPLVLDLDKAAGADNRIEFVRFGATSTISMNDLTFAGQVNGTPLYVRTSDAGPIRADLDRHFRTTMDLTDILEADRDLAERFSGIETYYVAVEPGCVFQPVSSTMIVRRTRG